MRLLGEARSRVEVLESAGLHPRVLLLDGVLCLREGTKLIRTFRRQSPQTRILVVTRSALDPLDLLAQGARGYLRPLDLAAFLAKAVRALHEGEAWVPRRMVSRVLERLARRSSSPGSPDR